MKKATNHCTLWIFCQWLYGYAIIEMLLVNDEAFSPRDVKWPSAAGKSSSVWHSAISWEGPNVLRDPGLERGECETGEHAVL